MNRKKLINNMFNRFKSSWPILKHLNCQTGNYNELRFYRTSNKAHLTISRESEEIIIGTILGDMSVEKPKETSASC